MDLPDCKFSESSFMTQKLRCYILLNYFVLSLLKFHALSRVSLDFSVDDNLDAILKYYPTRTKDESVLSQKILFWHIETEDEAIKHKSMFDTRK